MSDDLIERLRGCHPIQYGWRSGEIVLHTENDADPIITERMNRCPVCEQWSPCDVREAADRIEQLSDLLERAERQLGKLGLNRSDWDGSYGDDR